MAVPSDAHMVAFGRIIHNFAAVESGIKIALSGILELNLDLAMIAFQPYTASTLKRVAKSISKEKLKPHLSETFIGIVGEWCGHSRLRNDIAHNRWTEGAASNSIKPRYLSINADRAEWFGDGDEEAEYSAADLENKALHLHNTNERLKAFLQASGLQSIIEAKIAAASA